MKKQFTKKIFKCISVKITDMLERIGNHVRVAVLRI